MQAMVTDSAAKVVAMDLSVVIATVGVPGVAETVESVAGSAAKAGREVETVVVWAGASPAPPLPGARAIEAFPAGIAYSRNRGLEASGAAIVAFVDDDELVDPDWVAAVLEAFEREPAAAGVFGPIAPRDERGLPYCHHDAGGEFRLFAPGTAPWRVGSGGNMAFRREPLMRAGGFDPLFGLGSVSRSAEETELIHRLLSAGHVLAWSPQAVVYHPTKTREERLTSRFPYAYGLAKVARRHRAGGLAARYGREIAGALASRAAAGDGRRLRETLETLRGFSAGLALRGRPLSPLSVLERAPGPIAGLTVEPEEVSYRPDPHFVYRVGSNRLLHVYANPSPRLRAGLAVRDGLSASGIPETFAVADGVDSLWVLEERLDGRVPPPGLVEWWFEPVATWALGLDSAGTGRVREGSWWADEAVAAVEASSEPLRDAVEAALEQVGDLPARAVHGDFQRKNILLDEGSRVGVIDWEHAHDAGPPGLDLLFLAVMARSDRPDRELLLALADDRDPDWAPLRAQLRQAGVAELRPFLLAMLAVWASDEDARAASPGMTRAEPIYRQLLLDLGPGLAV